MTIPSLRLFCSLPVPGMVISVAAVVVLLAVVLTARANNAMTQEIITPAQALRMADDERIMIIDIRRPSEWRKTGIPVGAERATVRLNQGVSPFLKRIAALTNGDKSQPIALICAAGVRSKHASRILQSKGYTQVLDIGEGMLGNDNGIGWLRRGLPISTCLNCK
jgi:rhodanese-related sulfurtransferase